MSTPTRTIEVQATEQRFKDILTDAFDDRPTTVEGDTIRIGDGDRHVVAHLHDQPTRHLGSLDLPMEKVRFEFHGHDEAGADDFMEKYREATMRTGG